MIKMSYVFNGKIYKELKSDVYEIENGVFVDLVEDSQGKLHHAFHTKASVDNDEWDKPYKVLPFHVADCPEGGKEIVYL